jgi:hypothetical protein
MQLVYDTTRYCGILRTDHQWNLRSRLPLLSLKFFQDRYFRFHLSSVLFAWYRQENVGPRGSTGVVSVTLRNGHQWDSKHGRPVIFCRPQSINIRRLHWALEKGFSYSTTEDQCVHLTCLWGLHPPVTHFLNYGAVPFVPSIKVLGLLDCKMLWKPHWKDSALSADGHIMCQKYYLGGIGAEKGGHCSDFTAPRVRYKVDYIGFTEGSARSPNCLS